MPKFSIISEVRLKTCHPDIQRVLREAIKYADFTILCGHRGKAEQDKAVIEKKSKVSYPNSKHNKVPSLAVDIAPYPIDWNNRASFYYLAGFIIGLGKGMGVELRYGGDWNGDFNVTNDGDFLDLPHLELKEGSGAV